VNRSAGARSQLAGLVTAGVSLATLLLLAPLLGLMPQATLAAVVIVYSIGLIEPAEFRAILRIRRMEFLWAAAAFAGVVVLGTLKGIAVAVIVSLVALSYQAARPRVYVLGRKPGTDVFRPLSPDHPDDETFPGLLIARPEGRLFFANAQLVSDRVRELVAEHAPRVVILDLSRVFDIEYSALQMMTEGEHRLTAQGVTVWLAGLNPDVLAYVRSSGLADHLGKDRMFANARAGIARYLETRSPDDVRDADVTGTSGPVA
jgi:MFS superfamily sulfate permease-like transporter